MNGSQWLKSRGVGLLFSSDIGIGQSTVTDNGATATAAHDTDSESTIMAAIPAYNEAASIAQVVEETLPYVDIVLVVDDGSTDDTAPQAAAVGATVVEHEYNQGYGAALQTAFSEADERGIDHLVTVDGDGQHKPSDIPRLVERQQESGDEIVIGSRFSGDGETDSPLYRRFGIGVMNGLTNFSMGQIRSANRVSDTQSGFRAFNRRAIESLAESNEIGDRMSASTDILHHANFNGFDIGEVGTTITYDVENPSSHNPIEHGIMLLRNTLYTIERQRPIMALSFPGFTSALVGIGLGYWTIFNFLSSGTFPIGVALASSVFLLAGIFACFTGIILHTLNAQVVHRIDESQG